MPIHLLTNENESVVPVHGVPGFWRGGRQPRVITADVWSFFRHLFTQMITDVVKRQQALAFLDQSLDFYTAAANPRQASRPLLYYYSFMNMAKAYLIATGKTLASKPTHGISDPSTNITAAIADQVVQIGGVSATETLVFPEFLNALGTQGIHRATGDFEVLKLFEQIPAVHRTCCTLQRLPESFCPIAEYGVVVDAGGQWALRLAFLKHKQPPGFATLTASAAFRAVFRSATSTEPDNDFELFATRFVAPNDAALLALIEQVRALGIWAISTITDGTRYYLNADSTIERLPQLAATYAIIFYLGSITRYKPYDFEAIVGDYAWLVNEFLDTQPAQFLYLLASQVAGTDVVLPHAVRVSS